MVTTLPLKDRLIKRVNKLTSNGCWEWTGYKDREGYGVIKVDGATQLSHRMSWKAFRGEIPYGMCVLHKCDNPKCINPDHLFIGTQGDNIHDCAVKGRKDYHKIRRKLKPEEYRGISILKALGVPTKFIAEMYNISRGNVYLIAKRDGVTYGQ